MDAAENIVVIVEPHQALLRYVEIVQRRFEPLVLTGDPLVCQAALAEYRQVPWETGSISRTRFVKYEEPSAASMLKAISPYRDRVVGAVAANEAFVPVTAELGRVLGLDYAKAEDSICQHLKTAMKRRLVERGVNTPRFEVARGLNEAINLWHSFDHDCIVKMADLSNSLNVFRATTRKDLENAWDMIVNNTRGIETPFELSREVILEQFVGGRELTVEGYVQGNRVEALNFSKKLTAKNFIVVGHYIPALVSATEARQLTEIAEQCVKALGVRNTVFHVEVHIMDGVPYVIECAARPPGQHTVELIEKCYGIDLMEINIDLATGRPVNVPRTDPLRHYGILAIYSDQSGVFDGIEGLDELEQRGGVLHSKIGIELGAQVEALDTFHDKYGLVVLEDSTAEGLRQKAEWLRENVKMVVYPG